MRYIEQGHWNKVSVHDWDRTSAIPEVGISAEVVAAFQDMWRNKHATTFVTANRYLRLLKKINTSQCFEPGGRFHTAVYDQKIRPVDLVIPNNTPVAISQGANIVDKEGKSIWAAEFPSDRLHAIVDAMNLVDFRWIFYTQLNQDGDELLKVWSPNDRERDKIAPRYEDIATVYSAPFEALANDIASNQTIMFSVNPIDTSEAGRQFAGLNATPTFQGYYDLVPDGISKLTAAERLADIMGLDEIEYGAGDDHADILMFTSRRMKRRYWVGHEFHDRIDPSAIFVANPDALGRQLQKDYSY